MAKENIPWTDCGPVKEGLYISKDRLETLSCCDASGIRHFIKNWLAYLEGNKSTAKPK